MLLHRRDNPSPKPVQGGLAARLLLPVQGAWERLDAGPGRREALAGIFSAERMRPGGLVALVGPAGSGKSAVALAACDRLGLRAVYLSSRADQDRIEELSGCCLILDPVSAYSHQEVLHFLNAHRLQFPMILVDRNKRALTGLLSPLDPVVELHLPSTQAIVASLEKQLKGYRHSLSEADLRQLALRMHAAGLSTVQVNQISVDAALARLQHGHPVDRGAMDEALQVLLTVRTGQTTQAAPSSSPSTRG